MTRIAPEYIYHGDRIGLAIASMRNAMQVNRPNENGSIFLGEHATRFRSQLPAMEEAGLLFPDELSVLTAFYERFDSFSDYLREFCKFLLRQIWREFQTETPDWVALAEERKSRYEGGIVVVVPCP